MIEEIIVRNKRVIGEYFDIEINEGEDLLKRNEKNVKEFIDKYKVIFLNISYDKLDEFEENTGIIIKKEYRIKGKWLNYLCPYYLDQLGIQTEDKYQNNIPVEESIVFKNHLTIVISVDSIIKENDDVYAITNNKKKLIYKRNDEYENSKLIRYKICDIIRNEDLTIEQKVNSINEIMPSIDLTKINIKEINQIKCIWPYYDVLILTNNGNLFKNNRLYAKNVRELIKLASFRTYIIFHTQEVEMYTNAYKKICNYDYPIKKVLACDELMVAMLDYKRNLHVHTIHNANYCDRNFSWDGIISYGLCNVDDFKYTYNSELDELNLIISSNSTEIVFLQDFLMRR